MYFLAATWGSLSQAWAVRRRRQTAVLSFHKSMILLNNDMLLHEKLRDKTLILASRSPRRHELLRGTGLKFEVADGYDVEEVYPADVPVQEVSLYLARLKSEAYPKTLATNEILITADTVVVLGDEILGKPKDRDDAVSMLARLSGREHTVITGVAVRDGGGKNAEMAVATRVWFRELGREEIEYYVDTFRPYDKAGAYGIQEWIGYIGITGVEGSFYNVMGLPVQALCEMLKGFV